jgi:predicted nucleic acid-binding protein
MKIDDAFKPVSRLFLDTAPIIYHVEGVAAYQPLTDFVFQRIGSGACEAVTSPITLAECLVRPYQIGDAVLVQRFRDAITAGANTRYISLDAAAERAAEIRARYNLSLTDSFQVAAAMLANCDAFLTNDLTLKRVQGMSILVLDELEI